MLPYMGVELGSSGRGRNIDGGLLGNRVRSKMCGTKEDEVIGARRRIREELLSADGLKKVEMGGEDSTYGGEEKCV
jgi:hypothetical protein